MYNCKILLNMKHTHNQNKTHLNQGRDQTDNFGSTVHYTNSMMLHKLSMQLSYNLHNSDPHSSHIG